MWCTRWYLPLILLPFPTAPVYFLVLFILSLTLHAQPCFYCISLIATVFFSSYYWQPLPLSASLSTPWSTNVTTFGDALLLSLPNYMSISAHIHNLTHPATSLNDSDAANITHPEPELLVPLHERGWCDLSLERSVFEPFNLTRWEVLSVEQLKADLKRREKEALALTQPEPDETTGAVDEAPASPTEGIVAVSEGDDAAVEAASARRRWMDLFMFPSLTRGRTSPDAAPPPLEPEQLLAEPTPPPPPHTTPAIVTEHIRPETEKEDTREPLPWLRREYDLKPYGIDAVIDFGWSRTAP